MNDKDRKMRSFRIQEGIYKRAVEAAGILDISVTRLIEACLTTESKRIIAARDRSLQGNRKRVKSQCENAE